MPWIQLAVAAYGAYSANEAREDAKKQMAKNDPIRDLIMGGMEYSQPFGKSLIRQGTQGMLGAKDWYTSLLNGSNSSLTKLLGPQLSALGDQNQQLAQNSREFGQRGGMTSAMAAQQPFEQRKAQGDMLMRGRAMGAQGLAGLSGQMVQSGTGLLRDGQMSGLGLMGQNTHDNQVGFNMGQQIGGGLGSALGAVDWQSIPWGQIFGGGQQDTIGQYDWGSVFGNQAQAVGASQKPDYSGWQSAWGPSYGGSR